MRETVLTTDTTTFQQRWDALAGSTTSNFVDAYHHIMVTSVPLAGALTALCALIAINIAYELFKWKSSPKKKSARRETPMDPNARKTKIREWVRDAYVNALHELYRDGAGNAGQKISRAEYEREMLRLRQDLGLDVVWKINLHPRAIQGEFNRLKDEIKGRLNGTVKTKPKQPTVVTKGSKLRIPTQKAS